MGDIYLFRQHLTQPVKQDDVRQNRPQTGAAVMDHGADNIFFKVVAIRAGNLKTVKSNRKPLESSDVAVTIHRGDITSPSDALVDSLPSHCSDASASAVHILPMMGLEVSKLEKVLQWERTHKCKYMLPHFCTNEAVQLVAEFFALEALEGKTGRLQATRESEQLLQEMQFEGWVSEGHQGWQLSRAGISQLQVVHVVAVPKSIMDLALTDGQSPTTYSLLVKLERAGWSWSKKPKGPNALPPYVVGAPKQFFTPGNVISVEYLMCLDQAPEILGPGVELHHCMKPAYYEKILGGDVAGALQILDNDNRKRERKSLEDAHEEPRGEGVLMLADEGMVWQAVAPAVAVCDVFENTAKADAHNAASHVREDTPDIGMWLPENAGDDIVDEAIDSVVEEVGGPSSSSHAVPAPASSSSARPTPVEKISRSVQPQTLEAWGAGPQKFRITWRKPTSDCKNGSWQGICPYHAKGPKTKCTKALTVSNSTEEAKTACLRMIQHWLVSAGPFDRAWKHQQFNPRSEETPPYETLLEKSKSLVIATGVLPDSELDKVPESAAPAAKGKAKGKAKAKQKSKAKKKKDGTSDISITPDASGADSDSHASLGLDSSSSSSSSSSS